MNLLSSCNFVRKSPYDYSGDTFRWYGNCRGGRWSFGTIISYLYVFNFVINHYFNQVRTLSDGAPVTTMDTNFKNLRDILPRFLYTLSDAENKKLITRIGRPQSRSKIWPYFTWVLPKITWKCCRVTLKIPYSERARKTASDKLKTL